MGVELEYKINQLITFLLFQAIYLSSKYKKAIFPLNLFWQFTPWTPQVLHQETIAELTAPQDLSCILHLKTQSLFKNGH